MYASASASLTWQLWVDPLRHVGREVARHLPPDVHQHPGVGGRDLVDQDGAGVGQHQLGVVGPELGAVLWGAQAGGGGLTGRDKGTQQLWRDEAALRSQAGRVSGTVRIFSTGSRCANSNQ